jgi:thiol-disulfide isomerase/thioredoxin
MLQQSGHDDAALEAYRAIGSAYKDSDKPTLASEARSMLQRAREIEVGLNAKLDDLMASKPDSVQPVMDALRTLLAAEEPGRYLLELSSQVSQLLEISGHYAEAGQAMDMIEKAYRAHPDKQLVQQAATSAENGRRRAALVGQPFAVEGVLADGSPLDWGQYQGKVVLVDFWATWCGPCLQEIPHMQRNYEAYRDKGFEIVGVNLDDDPATMKQFLAAKPLPWTSVVSADPNGAGFNNPLAVKCGVDAIPFMVLVGRDGNVNALHVRGDKLDAKLAELLGK